MFNMMFPKMSSNMMQAMKNGLSTGKPMEMNAPAAGAMNVVNMAQSKPAEPPQSTAPTGQMKMGGMLSKVMKKNGIVGGGPL